MTTGFLVVLFVALVKLLAMIKIVFTLMFGVPFLAKAQNVGIGTNSPTALLEVFGKDAKVNGLLIGKGGGNIISNTVLGDSALTINTTGDNNTALGSRALYHNVTGNSNSAIGFQALLSNTSGGNNTILGYQALLSNTTGSGNIAIGFRAGYNNITGTDNIFSGFSSGISLSRGSGNIFIGSATGAGLYSGSGNIFIGLTAGYYAAATNNKLFIDNVPSDSSNAFIYGDMGADSLRFDANVNVTRFSRLGRREDAAPAIKMKKFTATSAPAQNGSITVAHGLNRDKILSIQVLLTYAAGTADIPASYLDFPGYEYNWQVNNTDILIVNKNGNSANILSKPIKILVVYEE